MRGVTEMMKAMVEAGAISTHTPHARRDLIVPSSFTTGFIFQLTRLMRGVTSY